MTNDTTPQPPIRAGDSFGVVAYLQLPLSLAAMEPMAQFIEIAYGKACVCVEEPPGWLKITTTQEPTR